MASSLASPIGESQLTYSQSRATRKDLRSAAGTNRVIRLRGVSAVSQEALVVENPKRDRAWAKARMVIITDVTRLWCCLAADKRFYVIS